jgi:hypothetical protein
LIRQNKSKAPGKTWGRSGRSAVDDGIAAAAGYSPSIVNYTRIAAEIAIPSTPAREEGGAGNIELLLSRFDDLHEGWNCRSVKEELHKQYYEWLSKVTNWSGFFTLTFNRDIHDDQALKCLRNLIRYLNEDLFGSHYTRKVGHSYFSYVYGKEHTLSRQVGHIHMLTDKPINFERVHTYWNRIAGFVCIEKVTDQEKVLRYVTKYVCKEGQENVDLYIAKKFREPDPKPVWWRV